MSVRIAVLASGRGSNLRALLDHLGTAERAARARVALVASDRPGAGALALAAERGVATALLAPGDAAHAAALLTLLRAHDIALVVLAGYLRRIPADVVRAYAGRMVNVHPALLPAFGGEGMYGERVHRAVLAAGARVTGVTVHLVDDEYDRGAIVAQWPVPVLAGDTPALLAARVLRLEHLLLPRVVEALATGSLAGEPPSTRAPGVAAHAAEADAGAADAGAADADAPRARPATPPAPDAAVAFTLDSLSDAALACAMERALRAAP